MLCDKEIVEIRNEIKFSFGDEWFDFLSNGKFHKSKNKEKAQEFDLKFISKIDTIMTDEWGNLDEGEERWVTTFSIGHRFFSAIVEICSWGEDKLIGAIYEVKPVEKIVIEYEPL